jgi:hypothetical protein
MASPASKIGILNAALGAAIAFANPGATQAPAQQSVSTKEQINNTRGITRQRELQRQASISLPDNIDREVGLEPFEILYYPEDIRKFYMRIDFFQYRRPTPIIDSKLPATSSICLPIPGNLRDDFSLNYYEYDAGVTGGVVGVAEGILSTMGVDVSRNINVPADQGMSGAPAFQALFNAAQQTQLGGGQIGSQIAQIGAQFLKSSFNPLKSIVFDSPNLKNHNFSWVFSPKNKSESEMLRKIIKKIKTSALPRYSLTGSTGPNGGNTEYNIFNYPYMAKINLYPWASDPSEYDKQMFQTKYGFIDNFSINYSPENNVSFFDDDKNSPAFVELSISFREIEIWTANDFGAKGKLVVGDITAEETDRRNAVSLNESVRRATQQFGGPRQFGGG